MPVTGAKDVISRAGAFSQQTKFIMDQGTTIRA